MAAAHMIAAIEELHTCRVECHVRTATKQRAGGLEIDFVATFPTLPGSDLPREIKVSHVWPTKTTASMAGLFYNLCWQLDYAIQQAYEQLPLTPK